MREAIAGRLVGTKVARVEDPRLLTGTGRYVDDVTVPGMLHAALRAQPARPRGHPRRRRRRRHGGTPAWSRCTRAPTCEALTYPFMGLLPLPGLYHPVFFALAVDRVRVVGDPVALIIAESRYVAEDAAQLVVVDYEELPPIATIEHTLDPSRPAIWPGAARQRVAARPTPSTATSTPRSRGADRVVRERFVQHRYSNQPMETRGCVAEVDPVAGTVQYHAATQNTHLMKWSLAALTGRRPVWRVAGRDRPPARPHGRALASGRRRWARRTRPPRSTAAKKRRRRCEEPIGEGLSAPVSPGKAMAQTFLREPIRIVHLARIVLGLLARDPVDAAARHRAGRRRRVRGEGAPPRARTSRCSRPRSTSGAR